MNHNSGLYSKDNEGIGVAHEITSPANQLGKTKPNQAFRSTRNAFNSKLTKFSISLQRSFLHCCSFVTLCNEWNITTNEVQWSPHFSV